MNSNLIIIVIVVVVLLYLYYNKKEHFSNQYGSATQTCKNFKSTNNGLSLSADCLNRNGVYRYSYATCISKKFRNEDGSLRCE
jgi:hypothetical protein